MFSHFSNTPLYTKKRDCNITVSHSEALVLPFFVRQQHQAHADMYI